MFYKLNDVDGTSWCICQDINLTPKEFKAAVIKLVGDLLELGSDYRAYKDGTGDAQDVTEDTAEDATGAAGDE